MLRYAILISLVFPAFTSLGQNKIVLPKHNDEYSLTVARLEKGEKEIDFAKFRKSFLDSKQYKIKQGFKYSDLKKAVYDHIKNKDYKKVVETTQEMLSIDYTSMFAHKYLYQTYRILGDTANMEKYKHIELSLLRSIINSGDGKTCETAWQVTQIEEEYFILQVMEARLIQQALTSSSTNTCDKMHVTEEGQEKDYYFGIDSFMGKYKMK